MSTLRILFAGTPDFAIPPLTALAKQYSVIAVFTQADAKVGRGKKNTAPIVKQVAQQLDIPVFQPSELEPQRALIESLKIDVMVVVAYGILIPKAILELPRLGCINIHASLLPRWRGAAPIHRAIEAGDLETGISIMQMDQGLDTGPIHQVLTTPIFPNDTTPVLHDRLADLGAEGICQTLDRLLSKPDSLPIAQSALGNQLAPSYAKKITKQEANINWHQAAKTIEQKIRALLPWPVCESHHRASSELYKSEALSRIRIYSAAVSNLNVDRNSKPGEIITINAEGIHVKCRENALVILTLQKVGGNILSAKDFLNGYKIQVGDYFVYHP